jgi:hypothetical protein
VRYRPGQRSRHSESLWAIRSGDRFLVGMRFSIPLQTGPKAHPACCTIDTISPSRGESGQSVTVNTLSCQWKVANGLELYNLSVRSSRLEKSKKNAYGAADTFLLTLPMHLSIFLSTSYAAFPLLVDLTLVTCAYLPLRVNGTLVQILVIYPLATDYRRTDITQKNRNCLLIKSRHVFACPWFMYTW